MRQKAWIAGVLGVLLCGIAFAYPAGIRDPRERWVGSWKSTGVMTDGAGGKPMHISSDLKCGWSPEHGAVICEQAIQAQGELHHQITVYTRDTKSGAYYFTTMGYGGNAAHVGGLEIRGNTWTYESLNAGDLSRPEFKSINIFKGPNEVDYKVMRSKDHQTWETIGEGKTIRVR